MIQQKALCFGHSAFFAFQKTRRGESFVIKCHALEEVRVLWYDIFNEKKEIEEEDSWIRFM